MTLKIRVPIIKKKTINFTRNNPPLMINKTLSSISAMPFQIQQKKLAQIKLICLRTKVKNKVKMKLFKKILGFKWENSLLREEKEIINLVSKTLTNFLKIKKVLKNLKEKIPILHNLVRSKTKPKKKILPKKFKKIFNSKINLKILTSLILKIKTRNYLSQLINHKIIQKLMMTSAILLKNQKTKAKTFKKLLTTSANTA